MTTLMPESIAGYFATDNQTQPDCLDRFFTPDATVIDEGRIYRGVAMIAAWRREAKTKYQYTVEPMHFTQQGNTVKLVARLAGNFPGSPVELTYRFVLHNGKIAALEIH